MSVRALSIEDTNLNKVAKITATSPGKYSDIDLSFVKRKDGDIFKKRDANAVKQAVKNLIMTNQFEKPFMPYFGANIQDLLFELSNDFLSHNIETQIVRAIENYEPRARVLNVSSSFNDISNTLDVSITFQIISTDEIVVLETQISRLR